jgi:hypothetical protein
VPTVASSTDRLTARSTERGWRDPVVDLLHLLRFRRATVRRRGTFRWASGLMLVLTVGVATVPAFTPGAGDSDRSIEILLLLPTGFAGFLSLAVVSAVVSGGGRELISRDQGVAFPVSPTTDHLGALVLSPLNIAWLIQGWVLLGSTAYAVPAEFLAPALVVVLLWLAVATAIAQVIAWSMEAVRRQPGGLLVVRGSAVLLFALAAWLQATDRLTSLLDAIPTLWIVLGAVDGWTWRWALTVVVELVVFVAAVLVGILPAHVAARRLPRDEAKIESGSQAPRPHPRSDLIAFLRMDRASVWRTVPMRRGMIVLAVGPGLVALAGGLPWHTMTILPGLVASGGALLFGVNAWCLDGRGGLWRESIPASPSVVWTARTIVLGEFLLIASLVTILLGSVRAGIPEPHELAALVCTLLVVTVQVVAAGMRWSAQRPYSVDLRSARATPAPPIVMVGYSSRLAVSTTLTGLVFSSLSQVPAWEVSALVAVPFLAWSTARLLRTRTAWIDPVDRARVVMAVTA